MAFEQIDLFVERGASRLVAREALLEILVLGIDEPCLDRFEETLDGGVGGSALVAQSDDVALALGIGTCRALQQLRQKLLEAGRIEQTLLENLDDGVVHLLHGNIVVPTGAILLPAHVRTGIV
ncbi:hypothetical protein A3748_13085 [Erythrobacter sp. HI0077]|nr:hypothetical protein A3745_06730 [Erythrobacter sp. HI0074]KZZ07930.1 hypothetical protein A3748_13085 [Erythrobacter sp. HI0077]